MLTKDSSQENAKKIDRRDFIKVAAAGLIVPAAVSMFGSPGYAQQPKRGGHLKLGLAGGAATDSIDPAKMISQVMFVVNKTWGDTLVETHPETRLPLPALATSWESSADATVWTFKIRKDVAFHDGKRLTTDDVVATLRRHSDASTQSGALGMLKGIKEIENRGGDLVIVLETGNADMPLLLSTPQLVVQQNGGLDNPNSSNGTGPYKMVDFEPGVRITFERNQNDWRSDRGFVDTVEVITMNDTTARIAAISSGRVHAINQVDPKTISLLKRAPNLEVIATKSSGNYNFAMHCDTAPFDNNDLRLALKYAINREEMLEKILHGYGSIGNDVPVNSTFAFFPEGIEQRTYDPDKAAFHYKKSGHSGAILLRTSEVAFSGAVDASVLYQESARQAGIEIDVRREPGDGYWTNVWNTQPFCASYWGGRATQDQIYSQGYLSTADWNDTRFKRDDFDKMIVQARAELDADKRTEMYRSMAMVVRDEGGSIVPLFNDFLSAISKQVKGYVEDFGNDMSNGYIASRVWLDA